MLRGEGLLLRGAIAGVMLDSVGMMSKTALERLKKSKGEEIQKEGQNQEQENDINWTLKK